MSKEDTTPQKDTRNTGSIERDRACEDLPLARN